MRLPPRCAFALASLALVSCGSSSGALDARPSPPLDVSDAVAPSDTLAPEVMDAVTDSDQPSLDATLTDWTLDLDTAHPAGVVPTTLLGHYDLSGSLLRYDRVPGLIARMRATGFSSWRLGVGRWELYTRLVPTDAMGVPRCRSVYDSVPPELRAPEGTTDEGLVTERDWFTDDGRAVSLADTGSEARYHLAYLRSVLDVASAFGAELFVDLDHMPRALSTNRVFRRDRALEGLSDACVGSWTNHVSNAPPADPDVFAEAAAGMVRRVVEGSGGERPRDAFYWELWNEPELGYAWDPSFEASPGSLDRYFAMALTTLVRLDRYRTESTNERARSLRFGLGGFARASTAASVIASLDTHPLPDGRRVPVDFVSFHSYANDPEVIVADLRAVTRARASSTHYRAVDLALTEWGADLATPPDPLTLERSLLVSTVLASAAALGVRWAHHSIFYDFAGGSSFGLVAHDGAPRPLFHAYTLLREVITEGAVRLPVLGAPEGTLSGGSVLATRAPSGEVRVLVVNRNVDARTVRLSLPGGGFVPSRVTVLDAPTGPRELTPTGSVVTAPGRSLMVVRGSGG